MPTDIPFSCHCGSFQAVINDAGPRHSNHGMCYCVDCQAFARHLSAFGKTTDASGGTEVYQIDPSHVQLLAGQHHLALLRLSPKGLFRWYASCCNTPLFNTMASPKIPFVGVIAANMEAPDGALGPLNFRYKVDQATGPVEGSQGSMLAFIARSVKNIGAARLSGRWKKTPLFDLTTLQPIAEPRVLTLAEKQAAYAQ